MVNRSPTSNYTLRSCTKNHNKVKVKNMAPGHGKATKPKTKSPKAGANKKPAHKKKVRCSNCTDIHILHPRAVTVPGPPLPRMSCDLHYYHTTLKQERESIPQVSPRVSPVRAHAQSNTTPWVHWPVSSDMPQATIPTLDARFTGHSIQRALTPSPRSEGRQGYTPPSPVGGNIQPPQQQAHSWASSPPGNMVKFTSARPHMIPHWSRPQPLQQQLLQQPPPDIQEQLRVQEQLRAANRHIEQLQAAAFAEQLQAAAGTRSGISGTGAQNHYLPPPLNPTPPPQQHASLPILPPTGSAGKPGSTTKSLCKS